MSPLHLLPLVCGEATKDFMVKQSRRCSALACLPRWGGDGMARTWHREQDRVDKLTGIKRKKVLMENRTLRLCLVVRASFPVGN
jgi:hypothetical protein